MECKQINSKTFYPTYEELKLIMLGHICVIAFPFYPTYSKIKKRPLKDAFL